MTLIMVNNKHFIYFLVIIFATIGKASGSDSGIPFPQALEEASIKVNNLNDILNGSLIIGNGDINALIYSDGSSILLNLTKNDIWDARVETSNDPPIPSVDLIKELGKSETGFPLKGNSNSAYMLPEGESWDKKDSYHSGAYPCPRQCAQIKIKLKDTTTSFIGEVDLLNAVANISETNGNCNVIKLRALSDRNVFLIETPEQILLEHIKSADIPEVIIGEENKVKWIKQIIPNDLDWPGMEFAVAIAKSENLNAIAIVSSMESNDVILDAVKLAQKTLQTEYISLIQKHELEWEKFWSRSGIKMSDDFLQSTWYRSLYFLRCFSKPGVQSVGLFAGLINDVPAWHGDYHTNYNIQQTYWSAYQTNHPELAEPYDRLIAEYLPRAKWLAKKVYSLEGAYYPHVMYSYEPADPSQCISQNGRQYIHHTWGMTLGVNGFSVQPLWLRYKYDPDIDRLKNLVYPVISEVATFYTEFIEQCEGDETIRLGPSVSPEHWGWTKYLHRNYNCTFDIALIRYTLKAAIQAAQILNTDEILVERFKKAIHRLPNYPLHEEDKTIVVDVEGAPPIEYNIPVPTTPVFPGDVISWWSTDDEKQVFTNTIENLKWNGNNATFMLSIARARLSMPNTQGWLRKEIEDRIRPNETISLNKLIPPKKFNDYGHYTEQFGVGMAISELLLQSVDDIIRIFPAVSAENRVSFVNLRAQGGFLISAEKSVSNVEKLQIKSLYGGELKLLSPWQKVEARTQNYQNYSPLELDHNGVVIVQTKVDEVWYFRSM